MRNFSLIVLIIVTSFLTGCKDEKQEKPGDQTRQLLTRYHGVWSSGKLESLDSILSPDFILHFMGGSDYKGIDGAKSAIMETRTAFPDWNEAVLDIVSDGSKAATRFHSTGTHTGKYGDIDSTGNKVDILEASIFRIQDGKIAEQWAFWDEILFQKQLRDKK